jgi:hypothetical protein
LTIRRRFGKPNIKNDFSFVFAKLPCTIRVGLKTLLEKYRPKKTPTGGDALTNVREEKNPGLLRNGGKDYGALWSDLGSCILVL